MKRNRSIFISLALLTTINANASTSLGTDEACDYSSTDTTIQDLIDAGEVNIAITNQTIYYENLNVNSSVSIYGGFSDCNDMLDSTPAGPHSVINGSGSGTVINASTHLDYLILRLNNLTITNGYTSSFDEGGGITVTDPTLQGAFLRTHEVLISNNESKNGGGVYISGADTETRTIWGASKTTVLSNRSTNNGGGVYCSNSDIELFNDSGIALNSTSSTINGLGRGGGIYATNDCRFEMYTGTEGGVLDFRGIQNNSATSHGGGIFANFGSLIDLKHFNTETPNAIISNTADSDNNQYGNGGGIYIEGQNTRFYSVGSLIKDNQAYHGGGISVNYLAYANFSLMRNHINEYTCWNILKCNLLTENSTSDSSSKGGAVHLNEGWFDGSNLTVSYNNSKSGNAFYLENESNLYLMYSSIYKNGADDEINPSNDTVIHANDSSMYLYFLTSAHNNAVAATLRALNSDIFIYNSILFEPVTNLLANVISSTIEVNCAVVDNEYGLTGSDYIIDDPEFVDDLNDDYHIKASSPAIDLCGTLTARIQHKSMPGPLVDIDAQISNWDDPNVDNATPGEAYDAGSDESYLGDTIFANGFSDH